MATVVTQHGEPGKGQTLTRQARRTQLIEVTVDLVTDKGYSGVSLAGIAQRAGITKGAVLYHFASKADVVQAAYQQVVTALTDEVAAAVEAAAPADGPSAYTRSMIEHLSNHPRSTRMIIEALANQEGERDTAARWRPLAEIIATARQARDLRPGKDDRTAALIIGGAIDAIVTESLHDPDYDTAIATMNLLEFIEAMLTCAAGQ